MSKSELERQTDRTVAAAHTLNTSVRKQTDAVQAQTAAIEAQTGAIQEGFAATVGALHEQTDVLRSVNYGIQAVALEMRGLREDIYAATQNREALEAKSKLDRAEQLLASDLPADALRLIREAEVLNPADFAVWSMKVLFCQRVLEAGIDGMSAADAGAEGLAAVERAVKLFPAQQFGTTRSLNVLRWLGTAAILLQSKVAFEKSIELYGQSVDAGGQALALSPPTTGMSRFLDDVGQGALARQVALANGRLLARIAASGDPGALQAMVPAWVELTAAYPDAVGPEVEHAIVNAARAPLQTFVTSVAAADKKWAFHRAPPKGVGVFREGLTTWITKLEEAGAEAFGSLPAWRDALATPELRSAELLVLRQQLDDVVGHWDPAGWKQAVGNMAEPPRPVGGGTMLLTAFGALVAVMFTSLAIAGMQSTNVDPARDGFAMMVAAVVAFFSVKPYVTYYRARSKPLPSPNTVEFGPQVHAHLARWQAYA